MKAHIRRPLLIIAFAIFSLLLLFYFTQNTNEKSAPKSLIASSGLPVHLIIPAINVNTSIKQIGVTANGEMEVPNNTVDVGWFKLGPRPGEKGSAVIAGHFNGKNGEAGVFFNLYLLKTGDKLYLEDDKGTIISFVVRENRIYDPGYAEEVFSRNDGVYLNLITCDGAWDGNIKSYNKRLVVFTDIIY